MSTLKVHFRSAMMLFGVTIFFLISWIPYFAAQFHGNLHSILKYTMFLNNATNCFIYLIFQNGFRRRVLKFFSKFLPLKSRISSEITNSSDESSKK